MFKYWKINEIKNYQYAWIYCPAMDKDQPVSIVRKGYREFRKLEKHIKSKYLGWVACTNIRNWHIMKFMAKMGAQPFELNLEEEKIWFKKDLKE